MLSSQNVNRYNSSMKSIIDMWYKNNLYNFSNKLEDTVYCNARNIIDYGGFDPNGGIIGNYINFKNEEPTTSLTCLNETDQFSVSNNLARLTFPVASISEEELYNIGNPNDYTSKKLRNTGARYWSISPNSDHMINSIDSDGRIFTSSVITTTYGLRPVVSLASYAVISSGTGSETDPWIVD